MRYLLLVPLVLLASCSVFQPSQKISDVVPVQTPLTETAWQLDSIIQFSPEKLERPVTLNFGSDSTHSVFGFSGCNYFNGTYSQERNAVAFAHLLSTKKYCFEGSKTETKFTSVLLTCDKVGFDKNKDKLYLMNGNKILAILHKTTYKGQ